MFYSVLKTCFRRSVSAGSYFDDDSHCSTSRSNASYLDDSNNNNANNNNQKLFLQHGRPSFSGTMTTTTTATSYSPSSTTTATPAATKQQHPQQPPPPIIKPSSEKEEISETLEESETSFTLWERITRVQDEANYHPEDVDVSTIHDYDDVETMHLIPFCSLDVLHQHHDHHGHDDDDEQHDDVWSSETPVNESIIRPLQDQDLWWGGAVTTSSADGMGRLWIPDVASVESLQDLGLDDEDDDEEDDEQLPKDQDELLQEEEQSRTARVDRFRNNIPFEITVVLTNNNNNNSNENSKKDDAYDTQLTWIFDPVEPLVQGQLPLDETDALQQAANALETCLLTYLTLQDEGEQQGANEAFQQACHILQQFPETAQVRYHPISTTTHTAQLQQHGRTTSSRNKKKHHHHHHNNNNNNNTSGQGTTTSESLRSCSKKETGSNSMPSSYCRMLAGAVSYPLFFFSATGNLPGVRAAYQAFPEAVAYTDAWLGTPLHYAAYHGVNVAVVQFLLERYPEAIKCTNEQYQTPLHLACAGCSHHHHHPMHDTNNNHQSLHLAVIQLLVEAYPAAAQLADAAGFTPLHLACQHEPWYCYYSTHGCTTTTTTTTSTTDAVVDMLQALTTASAGAVYASTRTLEKPLHVAARHRASPAVVHFLMHLDAKQAAAVDDEFQTPLHKACMAATVSLELVSALVQVYPAAVAVRDIHDERPLDVAVRLGGASPAVLELLNESVVDSVSSVVS